MRLVAIIASLGVFAAGQALGATLSDVNQGRYDQNGQASSDVGPTANYIVGTMDGIPDPSIDYTGFSYNFANFFSFDLAGIAPGSIVGASVEITGGQNVFVSGPPDGVYSLYVSTVDPAASEAGFLASLTGGNLIGTVSVKNGGTLSSSNPTPSDVRVTFNATGIADLNASAGSDFYIGGTFAGANPYYLIPGPGGLSFKNLFNGSGNDAGAELLLETTVPEAPTWALLLAGFGAVTGFGRWAVRKRALAH